MNDVDNLSSFLQPVTNQVDILHTLVSFMVCIIMAFVLRKFYFNRSFFPLRKTPYRLDTAYSVSCSFYCNCCCKNIFGSFPGACRSFIDCQVPYSDQRAGRTCLSFPGNCSWPWLRGRTYPAYNCSLNFDSTYNFFLVIKQKDLGWWRIQPDPGLA